MKILGVSLLFNPRRPIAKKNIDLIFRYIEDSVKEQGGIVYQTFWLRDDDHDPNIFSSGRILWKVGKLIQDASVTKDNLQPYLEVPNHFIIAHQLVMDLVWRKNIRNYKGIEFEHPEGQDFESLNNDIHLFKQQLKQQL